MEKKATTIRDIAKLAGVSVTTVSQILNGKGDRFSKKTQDKIMGLRDKYGYVPNYNARSLILHRSSSMIGILVPSISTPFFSIFIEGVQKIAQREKMIPLIFSANRDPALEQNYLKQMVERSIDGLIIASATMTTDTVNKIIGARNIPYILFDQNSAQHGTRVQTDDYRGGQLAAKHLINLGHRHIAMLKPKELSENFTQRLAGFRNVLSEYDAKLDVREAYLSNQGGYEATASILDTGATAVFTGNDDMAIGVLRGLAERGVKVPEQLSVIGYDGIFLDEYVSPQLTTIQQPIPELGRLAAQMLLDKIRKGKEHEQIQQLPVKLVVRESTGPRR